MTRTRIWIACAFLVAGVARLAYAQSVVIGPSDAIGFDYLDADLTAYTVTDFQVAWDNGAFGTIGLPSRNVLADTPAGSSTYKVIPAFTTGNHTFKVKVCNAVGCSAESSPFAFALPSSPATSPGHVRKVPR